MSNEGNQMIFLKEEQTVASFWRFSQEARGKLENISLMQCFQIGIHFR